MSCGFGAYFLGGMLGRAVGPIAQDFFYLKTPWGRRWAAQKAEQKNQEAEKELERQLKRDRLSHDRQKELLKIQFENNKQSAERQIFNSYADWQQKVFWEKCFPLRNPYDMPMGYEFVYDENSNRLKQCKLNTVLLPNNKQIVPLRVISAFAGSANNAPTINSNLSMFLTDNFSANDEHAVVSDIGSWKPEMPVNDASMNYLFMGLKGQPVMVLEPNYIDGGNTLRLKIWSWSLGEQLQYPVGFDFGQFDLKALRTEIVINERKKYMALLEKAQIKPDTYIAKDNEEIARIEQLGDRLSADEINLLLRKYAPPKEIQEYVEKRFNETISTIFTCAVSMYADSFHLYQYGTMPKQPELFAKMTGIEYLIPQIRDYYITLVNIAQNRGILDLKDSIDFELGMLDSFKQLNVSDDERKPLVQNVNNLVFHVNDGIEQQKYINRLKLGNYGNYGRR